MEISETRKCNLYNLKIAAKYFDIAEEHFFNFYTELLDDKQFLEAINERIRNTVEDHDFQKGIFGMGSVDSLDWFAFQRVLIYVLVRHLKPDYCLETGVYYGGNSAFLLNALYKNNHGILISIDLPDSKIREALSKGECKALARHPLVLDSELYSNSLMPGFIVPEYLLNRWRFVEGNSLEVIPELKETFGFYLHDSDHSHDFVFKEISLASAKLDAGGVIVVDDINWSNGFYQFCVENRQYPLCVTDNGKEDLAVRTGVLLMEHPKTKIPAIVGGSR